MIHEFISNFKTIPAMATVQFGNREKVIPSGYEWNDLFAISPAKFFDFRD